MKKHFVTALAALLSCAPAAFAAEQGITDTEIVIGEVNPYTGPPALLGKAHTIGMQMAFAEANATGVNGRKFKLLTEDDGYVTARTLQGVRKLVLFNGHGGNDFRPIIRELQPRTPIFLSALNWWQVVDGRAFFADLGDHAGELETSVMQQVAPEANRVTSQEKDMSPPTFTGTGRNCAHRRRSSPRGLEAARGRKPACRPGG